jgi:Ca-activated chloride channel family protein
VGYLLDEIRLRGENKEVVDEIAQLAKRFGIVTPYTSYLILEDQSRVASSSRGQLLVPRSALKRDVVSEVRERSVQELKEVAGKAAVSAGESLSVLKTSTQSGTQGQSGVTVVGVDNRRADWVNHVRQVGRKSFYFNGVQWMDSEYDADKKAKTVTITCLSDEYFKLLNDKPRIGPYLAQGQNVIVSFDGTTYEIKQP